MRISDWSSDVCSSDLIDLLVLHQPKHDIVAAQNVIGLLLERLDMIRRNGGVIVIDVSDFKFGDSFRAMLRQIIGEARTAMYHMILNELLDRCTAITKQNENLEDQLSGRSEERRGGKERISTCKTEG